MNGEELSELFSVFLTSEAWITLVILVFLEMILGIDNLVFIAITTDRLPENQKRIGRRLGLLAALIMRIIFLCSAAWIVSMRDPLFHLPFESEIFDNAISGRDLILLVGGIYLIYKGAIEIREMLSLELEKEQHGHPEAKRGRINMAQALVTIAVMDVVFSIDSVLTAVGLAGSMLMVMIFAVMLAIFVMMIFANVISEFINSHPEMKLLALIFIMMIGVKLIIESFGIELYIGDTEVSALNVALYTTMLVSLVLTILQMTYSRRMKKMHKEIEAHNESGSSEDTAQPIEDKTQSAGWDTEYQVGPSDSDAEASEEESL